MLPWVLFTILRTTRPLCSIHYSSLAVLSFFAGSRTHTTWGHCVCADISWFLLASSRVRSQEREKDKERKEQSDVESKVIHLKLYIGAEYSSFYSASLSGCPLLPSSALLSLSGSLWVSAVDEKCLWCRITTWHCWTLTALSNCLHELLSLPASFSWPGTAPVPADSTAILKIVRDGWILLLASCPLLLNSLDHVNYYVISLCLYRNGGLRELPLGGS